MYRAMGPYAYRLGIDSEKTFFVGRRNSTGAFSRRSFGAAAF